ncbi:ATP-binding response regulator [Sphingobium nicotianae]|uniref:histidine kinase n=1 Tax=Sphingobium nicotianae TaxID=2782607 RepID=A0A9X1DCH4_9SPHN|nr:ATP-binding protein [Sphingobium nicotianae]MBT2187607.1 response regulator [Sphingobium nicotianae]
MKRTLAFALAATGLAGLFIILHAATDGYDAILEALAIIDLTALGAVLLFGIRQMHETLTGWDGLAELSRAKQAAEAANLAKSRYLASVSHEIRSPLNAIYGYAQLFERGDGANAQEAARVILRCSEHLTNLVEGLLDISQLEFGVLRVRSEEVRLPTFIDQVVAMMRPAAAAKGLDFIYEPSERVPEYVRLDQSRFRQVLINLLSNAIKFTDSGSVTLRTSYSGQIATFEVRDTGPGIAPEDHERIFERFEQGTQAEGARVKPGAGLGLAIARTIVEILGGRLELESDLGAGACFRITMMLSEIAGKVTTSAPARRAVGYEGRQRSIVLCEDDADQRQWLERLLRTLGFDVHAHPNGEAALAAEHAAPDLAILDISMPGISGWEVAQGLRARGSETLKILMLSANSEELHRPDFPTPGHDRFLVKPVEFAHLVETIGDLLGLTWRWDADAEPGADTAPSAPDCETLDASAREHLVHLKEFLRIGYVRGIEAEIRQLEEAAPHAEALVGRLYDCLDRYDLAGMAKLLKES